MSATTKSTGSKKGLAEDLKEEGASFMDETRREALGLAARGNGMVADYISALAGAAFSGAQHLEGQGYRTSAEVVARAAREADIYAQRVNHQHPQDLVEEASSYARKHPGLIMGAAFTLGFCASRFFTSSAEPDEDVLADDLDQ